MRFRDRKHQLAVQNAERSDPAAQKLIAEFCDLINYPYQQQQGQFAVGFYSSVLPVAPAHGQQEAAEETPAVGDAAGEAAVGESPAIEEEAAAAPDAQETAQAENYIEDINEPSDEPGDFAAEAAAAAPSNGESPQPPPLSLVSSENAGEQTGEAEGEILSDDLFPEDAATAAEGETGDAAAAEVAEEATPESEPAVEHEAELEVEPESRAAAGEPHDDRDLAELDAELGIEDDEISRMAQELAADDKFDPQHPQHPHQGPENGSHQAH
jgi:hypothetical protein